MIYLRSVRAPFYMLLFLLGLAGVGEAQCTGAGNAAALSRRDDFSRVVDIVRSLALDVMPDPERRTVGEIDIRIPMDLNVTRVQAFRDARGQRIIEMSYGFLGMIFQLTEDFYFATESGDLEKFDTYLDYVNELVDRNERLLKKDHIKSFREYAEITTEKRDAIVGRDDYRRNVGVLATSAIGFVLTHEIGHHVFDHVDRPPRSPVESRRDEGEADRYAVALTLKMDISAFGALPALAFFATHEGKRANSNATHPLGICRVIEAFSASFDQAGVEYDRAKVRALYNQRCK